MSTMTVSAGTFRGTTTPRAAGAARTPAGVHLTRRGRLLLSLVVLLALVTGAVLLAGGPTALAGTDRPVTHERVTVQPGQTLWQIAERTAPGSDPRETVQRILDLNGLQTSEVQAGTALLLP